MTSTVSDINAFRGAMRQKLVAKFFPSRLEVDQGHSGLGRVLQIMYRTKASHRDSGIAVTLGTTIAFGQEGPQRLVVA